MNQFETFEEEFNRSFPDIEDFIDKFGHESTNPFINAELKQNLDEDMGNNYGYTDEKLKRIFYFPYFNMYIQFEGRNKSYSGTSWDSMKEVKPVTKTIERYE